MSDDVRRELAEIAALLRQRIEIADQPRVDAAATASVRIKKVVGELSDQLLGPGVNEKLVMNVDPSLTAA